MQRIMSYLAVAALTAPLMGCFFTERRGPRGEVVRECPPAHHWEGGACVHNGHGRDHRDHDDDDRGPRDHRHD